MKSPTKQRGYSKRKNIIMETICPSPFSSLSLSVSPSLLLSFSCSSSNNSKIKSHYTPLYWSFGTSRTAFTACQRRKWLMTHGALIKSFLFGQILLTMWPLNSIIAENGTWAVLMLQCCNRLVFILLCNLLLWYMCDKIFTHCTV